MASLLDKLRQQQSSQSIAAAPLGATEAAAKLLAAKTGKAQVGPIQPISIEAERAAQAQTTSQLGQVAQQGQVAGAIQGVQQEGQQQEFNQAKDRIQLQYTDLSSTEQQQLLDIDQKARHAAEKLGLDKETAAQDARLFTRRLKDKKYTDKLEQDGALKRAFSTKDQQKELTKLQLGSELSNLLAKLGFESLLAADSRVWQEKMKMLDAKSKYDLAVAAIKAEGKRQMVNSFTGGVQAGLGGIGKGGGDTSPKTTDTTISTSAGTGGGSSGIGAGPAAQTGDMK